MATINTIIVLRNDTKEAWETDGSYVLVAGEVGVGYMTVGEGDAARKVPIIKVGDGTSSWKDLPQAEGVFESEVVLTSTLGKYVPGASGYVKVPNSKGMTTSELLLDALSEVKEPDIAQPTIGGSATIVGGGEMGAYVTGVKWDGSFTDGSYQYGSKEKPDSTGTGLSASNVTWSIKNNIDAQTATSEDKTFTFTSDKYPQIDSESSKTYVTVTATYSLDASGARTPLNNVGVETEGKIASKTNVELVKNANATGYRKPFWGIKAAADAIADPTKITSAQVRALGKSGSATKGLPTTTAASPYVVAAGSQQVFFLAKAGTYSSLTATDAAAMNAGVTFTKVANAVNVEGANGYTATAYDMWYVDWGAGIDADKKLVLTWK